MSAPAEAPEPPTQAAISTRTAVLLSAIGVFAFTALLVLASYAPDLRQGAGGPDALSNSAVGFSGLVETLRFAHEPVALNRETLAPHRASGLLIVMASPTATLGDVEDLGFEGPILVILPKWTVVADPTHRGWVRKPIAPADGFKAAPPQPAPKDSFLAETRSLPSAPAPMALRATGAPFAPGTRLQAGPVDSPQTWTDGTWPTVMADGAGEAVLVKRPDKPIYVLSEPDLMNNHGLADERTFTVALAILHALRAGDGPMIFDLRLSGLGGQRNPLRLLFDPPFLAVTLCLAGAAALAAWQAFARFGPPLRATRAVALGTSALVENSAGLIRLAGREARMATRYADLTAARAARAVGAPHTLSGAPLIGFLDRLGVHRGAGERLEDLAFEANLAQTPQRAVTIAGRLFQWRRALTRDRLVRDAGSNDETRGR